MGYQVYEILLLFSIYSILGWVVSICGSSLINGYFENRGICRGPYCASYGIGALLILYAMSYLDSYSKPIAAFVLGIAFGLIVGLLTLLAVNGLCGERLLRYKWYYPLLSGAGGVILVCHLNPLITAVIRSISPWVHLAFLLVFWFFFGAQFVEGISRMMLFKKKSTISS